CQSGSPPTTITTLIRGGDNFSSGISMIAFGIKIGDPSRPAGSFVDLQVAQAGAKLVVGGTGSLVGILGDTAGGVGADATAEKKVFKSGPGWAVLQMANTYTGVTDVAAGILEVMNNTALGANPAAPVTVFNGATLLTTQADVDKPLVLLGGMG